nr:TonB-dependent receptor plug domain-containing protein [Acidobacteriota bacterium]
MKLRLTIAACVACAALFAQSPAPSPHKETVVVTGTADPVPLEESDRSVDVIGNLRKELLLFGNLGNVFQLDSSVDLQQRAPGVQADIAIRGGTFGQTLVLLNGMRIDDVQSAHHNFDVPAPLDAIGRVEILRGSGSTLYGSDAVGGVVNVLTRADEQPELVFRTAVGSFGTNAESGRLSFAHSIFTQQFSFERELSDGFEEDREYRNLSGSSETLIRTSLGATRIFFSGLDRPFGANQFYGDYNSWERTKTWFALVQQDLGRNTSLGFTFRRHTDLF